MVRCRRRQVQGERAPEPAGADGEDLGGLELLLPVEGDLRHDEVAAVTGYLVVGELDSPVGRLH
jgi:hypothetical protein